MTLTQFPSPVSMAHGGRYQDMRGIPLSPPTEIDALYGLLFASFYYLYLQVCGHAPPPPRVCV
jgi:hypothetical protein